jgi:integration host factor subunit alpha
LTFCEGESMAALTKDLLVKAVADETGFPGKQADELVEMLIELIKGGLASGEDVLISGFGKFSVKAKSQRRGRNPATGESMMLRPRRVVTFKSSGNLKKKLNP